MPQSSGWERKIAEGPPCVVLASPGFMQSGPSRQLLELWAPDSRNGLIVTGYSIEGTLARVSVHHSAWSSYGLASKAWWWSLCDVVACIVVVFMAIDFFPSHCPILSPSLRCLSWYSFRLLWSTSAHGCCYCSGRSLGHHERARRDHLDERSHHPSQAFCRLHLVQRPRRLLAELRVHRNDQGATYCQSFDSFDSPRYSLTQPVLLVSLR